MQTQHGCLPSASIRSDSAGPRSWLPSPTDAPDAAPAAAAAQIVSHIGAFAISGAAHLYSCGTAGQYCTLHSEEAYSVRPHDTT